MKFRDYRKPKSRADSVYARISKFNFTSVPLKINKNNIFLQKYFAIQKKSSIFAANLVMKYSELHRLLRKEGCYLTGKQMAGHPLWFSPKTGETFKTSNHEKQEVATGTLRNILKSAGLL